jgi:protein SCO1/2
MTTRLATALLAAALAPAWAAAPPRDDAANVLDADTALRASEAAVGRDVGDWRFLDRQGRSVRLADYRGKPLLVSFVYSGCFQICPTTTRALAAAVDRLAASFGAGAFNVVSIGFHQPFDSPTALRAFAAQLGVRARNWEFLSPPAAEVEALTRTFGFTYAATPAGFDHLLAVSVVDADGRIVAQVYGEQPSAEQIGVPLRRLLRAAPIASGAPLTALIERVRILCTVYDPKTGTYRTDWGLVLEIAGGATFAVTMIAFFLAEWRTQRRLRRSAHRVAPACDG